MEIFEMEEEDREWVVDQILSHAGAKKKAMFEVLWKSGNKTWLPYMHVSHLHALEEYLEALGIDKITDLKVGSGTPPNDDPQTFVRSIMFEGMELGLTPAPMTDTANPTASDNQTAASGLPPPPGEAPPPLPGNEQRQDTEMDLTSTGTAVTQAPIVTQPAPAQQAPNISAPQPVAPVVSQMALAAAQGMPSILHHQPAHRSDVQYYQPVGYQPLPQDSAPNASIGCGADFTFTSIPGKWATTNKNLWYNENNKSYFYIDSEDKFNLLKRIHPITLKGFVVFDCVLHKRHEDGLPLELQFAHIINKDRACSWGMTELDMEHQDWIVGKQEVKINDLKIKALTDWEFRKLME
ncbi:hypothetical protein DXG01_001819, partial [Tephrocybe rancida]